MKKRELTELKTKSAIELKKSLSDLYAKKLEAEVAVASGKESNLKALGKIRRDIAQILTAQGIIGSSQREEKSK